MKKKIYLSLVAISTLTVVVTALIISIFFFDFLKGGLHPRDIKYILLSIGPIIVSIIIFIVLSLSVVSSMIIDNIMKPVENVTNSLENILEDKSELNIQYDELKPFIVNLNKFREEINYYILKLEENDKFRRDFTANISHELKTPLTSINGYAELIASGIPSKEDDVKFGTIIKEEGDRLLSIIDSIIVLSNLEEVGLDLELQRIDINKITVDIVNRLTPILEEKNIQIVFYPDVKPIYINGNTRMIYDLIFNLINNGIKYNKEDGKIYIDIVEDDEFIIFKIRDTGIGIPEEDLGRIFERFYIGDKSRSSKVKSTGLGLSIVKHIVDLHMGSISVKSELNIGTEFTVKLKKAPTL